MTTTSELYIIIQRLEQRINALEKTVVDLKQPKKTTNKSFQIVPRDDYETYIAKISAKYSNIDEILKIHQNMECVKSKKNKLLYLQKIIHNMICNDSIESTQMLPIRFSANQLYNYTSEHGNSDEMQWHSLQLSHFTNHIKLIIKNSLKELHKWSEVPTSQKYSTEFRDFVFISVSEILGVVYNDDEFDKIIKCVIKKLH